MKMIKKCGAQGDLMFRRIAAVPKSAREVVAPSDDGIVVGHSETGHHHVVQNISAAQFFRENAASLIGYLETSEPVDVVHMRSWDTHETLRLPAGTWEVRQQREWSPEGWRKVVD